MYATIALKFAFTEFGIFCRTLLAKKIIDIKKNFVPESVL